MNQRASHTLLVVAEGIAVHTVITAAGLGALAAWARYCDARRRHGIPRDVGGTARIEGS